MTGDLAGAERLHEKAMGLATEQSNRPGEVFAGLGLAMGARRQGRLDVAEKLLRDALDWQQRVGFDPGIALTLSELGFVAEQRGDARSARKAHLDGLTVARRTGDARATALALEGLAAAHTLLNEHHQAARLLGAATAARDSTGTPLPSAADTDVARTMKILQKALGEETLNAELQKGRTAPPEDLTEDP